MGSGVIGKSGVAGTPKPLVAVDISERVELIPGTLASAMLSDDSYPCAEEHVTGQVRIVPY